MDEETDEMTDEVTDETTDEESDEVTDEWWWQLDKGNVTCSQMGL